MRPLHNVALCLRFALGSAAEEAPVTPGFGEGANRITAIRVSDVDEG
ncbi:MAG: hypothetical protein ACK5TO_19040 [Planctomycetaceae bacterium]